VGVKFGLPPIARSDARLFILGSLPGDASLAAGRYYAHPTNQFWRLLGSAIGENFQSLGYEDRLDLLGKSGIGLWDVIASASRPGSLDQAIRSAEHNQIDHLLHDYPDLQAIAFNGSTSSVIGRKLIGASAGTLILIDLPSSSAANTRPIGEKLQAWSRLAEFGRPAQIGRDDSRL
jgi:hypoxanthine-DNA glycosylase